MFVQQRWAHARRGGDIPDAQRPVEACADRGDRAADLIEVAVGDCHIIAKGGAVRACEQTVHDLDTRKRSRTCLQLGPRDRAQGGGERLVQTKLSQ